MLVEGGTRVHPLQKRLAKIVSLIQRFPLYGEPSCTT